jgi:RNA polymerase sigma factor (sigma-70 family)
MNPDNLPTSIILSAKAGDSAAQAAIMDRVDPFIKTAVKKVTTTHLDPEDFLQDARLAVLEALQRFDPSKGHPFETFVFLLIKGTILNRAGDYYQGATVPKTRLQQYWSAVSSTATILEAREVSDMDHLTFDAIHNLVTDTWSLDAMESGEDSDNEPADGDFNVSQFSRQDWIAPNITEDQPDLEELLECLAPRDRMVLEMAYGLTYGDSMNDYEVGQALGIDRSGVNRIRNRALKALRSILKEDQQ